MRRFWRGQRTENDDLHNSLDTIQRNDLMRPHCGVIQRTNRPSQCADLQGLTALIQTVHARVCSTGPLGLQAVRTPRANALGKRVAAQRRWVIALACDWRTPTVNFETTRISHSKLCINFGLAIGGNENGQV